MSLRRLGEILHAAAAVGSDAWDGQSRPATSGDDVSRDLLSLFRLLNERNISYLLVGGVALLRYVKGRNTQDIDLVLSVESLKQLPEIRLSDQNCDFARGRFRSLQVDLRLTRNPLFKQIQEQYAAVHRFHEIDVRTATVEGLILLKLYALVALYRQRDAQRIALYEGDILMLCQKHRPAIDPIFQVLAAHVDTDSLRELKQIVEEIQQRIARMEKHK